MHSDLLAADSGEQPRALDVDARVDERGWQVLGEVFHVVGVVLADGGRHVDVVKLIDFTDCSAIRTHSDLRLLIDYMSATESGGMLPHLFGVSQEASCSPALVHAEQRSHGVTGRAEGRRRHSR